MSDAHTGSPAPFAGREQHAGYKVVGLLFVLSMAMAALLFYRYTEADRFLVASSQQLHEAGASSDVEGCVDRALDWWKSCGAIESVCDSSVDSMMTACLVGADRSDYCTDLGDRGETTNFGFEPCRERGFDRETDRRGLGACAGSYRAIVDHCHALQQGSQG